MKNLVLFLTITCTLFSFTVDQSSPFVQVFDVPQIVEIKATLNKTKCNNKMYIPVALPKQAKGYIYSISAVSREESKNPEAVLLNQVNALSAKHDADKAADFIPLSKNSREFNLYILPGKENAESFFNCNCYKYTEKHIGTKPRSGYISVKDNETSYIAIENNRDWKTLRLKVEVVAVL